MQPIKSILFLGGGELGLPAIDWARQIGLFVIVNDKKIDAPGKRQANLALSFDATDARGLTTWALQNQPKYNIRACHCGSDFGLLTAAVVSNALGLPHSPLKAIINSLDKALMKEQWGPEINCPRSGLAAEVGEAARFAQHHGWPIIIKPTSASGSQGVGLAKDEIELQSAFRNALTFSSDGKVIVEQFIRGTHHDVNGIFWNDKFYPAGIGDRFFTKLPYFVPHHGYFPTILSHEVKKQWYDLLERGARALGINHGPVKADGVMQDGKCYVYEIANRFHGDIFTIRAMGESIETNPLYQYFQWIYHDAPMSAFQLKEDQRVGGWKTIFDLQDLSLFAADRSIGVFHKNKQPRSELVKNNDEIIGLAWAYGFNREQINQILNIDKNYEQV